MKFLELHYTTIQFLVKEYRPWKTAVDLLHVMHDDNFLLFPPSLGTCRYIPQMSQEYQHQEKCTLNNTNDFLP